MVPAWRHGNRSGKTVMSHAEDGGQAPDQASSGRQAGAVVQAGRVIAKTRRNGQHPDESRLTRQHQPWRAAQTDRPRESHSTLKMRPSWKGREAVSPVTSALTVVKRFPSSVVAMRRWMAAGVVVAAIVSLAAASSRTASAGRGCQATEGGRYLVVLGSVRTPGAARALRARAHRVGFADAVAYQPAAESFEVVLYGLPTKAAGAGVVSEAVKAGFAASLAQNLGGDCTDRDHDWEAVLGQVHTLALAKRLRARALAAGLDATGIESEGPEDFEVTQPGVESTKTFNKLAASIESQGFSIVSFEPS